MEKVVIIGSGPAGWTAALYTARAQLSPLVLTGRQPGGLLTTTSIVENFPGFPEGVDGYELMTRMQKQAERFGARVKFGTVEAADLSRQPFVLTVDGDPVESETVIIASGASHRHLGLDSEAKLEKKGVTFCATCSALINAAPMSPSATERHESRCPLTSAGRDACGACSDPSMPLCLSDSFTGSLLESFTQIFTQVDRLLIPG